jgi:eukaryotic-like serine/threonine-protein kinase
MINKTIEFVRKKDFKLVKKLGQGGFGETVLLHDTTIDERFVCKKYAPTNKSLHDEYFSNFVQEIKILYQLNHPNIARVFNYYLYPEFVTGYILMEYVEGQDIEDHVKQFPENLDSLFRQSIEGFLHLENCSILHRDIRPQNILVSENLTLKIIDFGFGKRAKTTQDFDKSISLNWPFLPPLEFKEGIYDFKTEVYFVAKLFEKIIHENQIEHFGYSSILYLMGQSDPAKRISSFSAVRTKLNEGTVSEIDFSESEMVAYREFSRSISETLSEIQVGSKYYLDIDKIFLMLEGVYQKVMLEENVPNNSTVTSCFVSGAYKFKNRNDFEVLTLKKFIQLLRGCSKAKKNIILSNLHSRFDNIKRYSRNRDLDDEVPF